VLTDLIAQSDRARFEPEVISLLPRDAMSEDLEALGVPVFHAGLRRDPATFIRWAQLAVHLRRRRPDLVHTWMYHGDVLGGLTARLVGTAPIVWHLHHSTLDFERFRPTTRGLAAVAAPLSHRLPARIIACAESARSLHVERGYDPSRMVVIRNGVDTDRFRPRPDPSDRRSLVDELGLREPVRLVGLAARYHPQKDHLNFVAAARRLAERRDDVDLVLCGRGVTADRPGLEEAAKHPRIHLLGERRDLDRLLPQLDVSTLSSAAGEACSLTLLESQACGVPCVTTDVGDSAYLVRGSGRVVPPRDPDALAAAWDALLALSPPDRRDLGRSARARVEAEFSLVRVARAVEAEYEPLLG